MPERVLLTNLVARESRASQRDTMPPNSDFRWVSRGWLRLGLTLLLGLGLVTGCSRQAKVSRHLERAERHYAQQRYEDAILEYMNVIRLDPANVQALERAGSIYYDRGQMRQAFQFLRRAGDTAPGNAGVRSKLARIYLASGQPEPARQEALAALKSSPTNELAILAFADAIATPQQVVETEQRLREMQQQLGEKPSFHIALGALALRRADLSAAQVEFERALVLDPKSSRAQLALANLRWRQGDLTQADTAFQAAVNLAPRDWTTRMKRAEFKVATGNVNEAKKIAEEITHEAPHYLPALFLLARIDFSQKAYDQCAARVKQVLDDNPADADALLLRAQISLAKGDVAQGIAELEKLRDQFSKSAQVHFQLGMAYWGYTQDLQKAAASFEKAVAADPNMVEAILALAELDMRRGSFDSVISSLSALVKRAPKLERAYGMLARAYQVQGRYDDALATGRQWKQVAPKNPEPDYLCGLALRKLERPGEARQAFEGAAALNPDFVLAVEQLADLDLREGQKTQARTRTEALVNRNAKNAGALLLLANVQLAQGATEQAEATCLKAIALEPKFSPPYLLLSQIYLRGKKLDQAINQLEALLKQNPDEPEALIQVAMIRHTQKEYAKARDAYEHVIKLNPKSALALNNLAYIYAENLNNLDLAYQYASRAHDLAPQEPSAADTLGWVVYQRRDYPVALSLLREAAAKRPEDAEIRFHLGMVSYMMGDAAAARTAFESACAKDFPSKSIAQRRLWVLNLDPQFATPEDKNALQQILNESPMDTFALLRMAGLAEKAGALDQAQELYRKAVEANPKAAMVHLALGRFFAEKLHDPGKALEEGSRAHDLAPAEVQVALLAGEWASQAGEFKRAYALLEEAVQKQPENPDALFELAWAAYQLGRVQEAERLARGALTISSSFSRRDAATQFVAALAWSASSAQAEQAQRDIAQRLQSDPHYLPALMAKAVLAESKGQFNDARQIYEDLILKPNPGFAPAARKLAGLYAGPLQNDAKAMEAGLQARVSLVDDGELDKLLGKVAFRRKDYHQAIQFLTEGAGKTTPDADLYYHLGLAYHALKQRDQAKSALEKALALKLDARSTQEANRLLAELK